uniref:Capsid protein n=1 Tax=Brazilian bird anellovirus type 1 TaxID=2604331 RepID=A0A5C0PVR3_9VIRU|nr:ORF1 [Brazilian bird anellovirus type 1]
MVWPSYRRRYRRWRRRGPWRSYRRRNRGAARRYLRRGRPYRRRRSLRVRRRRRRRIRGRKEVLTHWNPTHIKRCKIKGWCMALFSNQRDVGQKFEQVRKGNLTYKNWVYDVWGGGVSVRFFTLGILYQEHQLHRNIWTASNEGFDLARYMGTTFHLPPHPNMPYIFWWESNWGEPLQDDTRNLHPGNIILKKHRVIVMPIKFGNKKWKKVFAKPPSTLQSEWYFMDSWCRVGLVRFGFTPFNLYNPFMHGEDDNYGVWIGYWSDFKSYEQGTTGPPARMGWNFTDLYQGLGSQKFTHVCFYKWWWDTGEQNYIMYNPENNWFSKTEQQSSPDFPVKPQDGQDGARIEAVNMPYWMYFYGQGTLTAKRNADGSDFQFNPSIYAITWWFDPGKTVGGRKVPYDTVHSPSSVGNRRGWVLLTPTPLNKTDSQGVLQVAADLPTYRQVQVIMTGISNAGPFAFTGSDVPPKDKNINLAFTYTSYWQWGGIRPTTDTVVDPCTGPELPAVSVRAPTEVLRAALHPWDLDEHGIVTTRTLKRLIAPSPPHIFTGPPPLPEDGEPPLKSRRTEEGPWRVESSDGGSDTSESPESSPSGEETPEEEEETPWKRRVERILQRLRRGHRKHKQLRRRVKSLAKN